MPSSFLAEIEIGAFYIHGLPNWLFCTLVVAAYVAFALGGQIVVRRYLPLWFGDRDYNEIVGQYLSASGVFFGITLGLLSVAAWENFTEVESAVAQEASQIGVLYRTFDMLPEPQRAELTDQLRAYTRHEIDVGWTKKRRGVTPGAVGNKLLTAMHRRLTSWEPGTMAQRNLHAEALRQFSNMVEARRLRLDNVSTELPPIVWFVVVVGSGLNLSLMWLFVMEKRRLHDLLTGALAALLGLLVFMLAVMDNPFRGEFSVGPESFELIYDQFMQK